MYYQIHAGQAQNVMRENDDGEVKSIAILGGYIYPAGSDIRHDPTFEASSFMLSIVPNFGGAFVFALIIGTVSCGSSILVFAVLRNRVKRSKVEYQMPPEYRRP
jgi:hypothetical protein